MQAKQLNRKLVPLLTVLLLAGCISHNKEMSPAPTGGAETVDPAQGLQSPPTSSSPHYDDEDGDDPEVIEI